jgi:hypothetical protein
MHRQHGKSYSAQFLFAGLASALILASGAGFPAAHAADAQKAFTPDEQKTLMNFILTYDMGKVVEPGVSALLRAHDDGCAVSLVVDTYGVSRETAELFVRLVGQSNGLGETPGKP